MLTRLSRFGLALPRSLSLPPARFMSQSKPSSFADLAVVKELHRPREASEHGEVCQFDKNPEYHGFSSDPVQDEWNMKVAFFMGISVSLVIGGTFVHYLPEYRLQKWSVREAERLVILREKEGVPLISADYYDPSKLILPPPSDSE